MNVQDCIIFLIWAAWVLFNQKNADFKATSIIRKITASLGIHYYNILFTKVQKQNEAYIKKL